jgi:His-Xaa-Ser system protein (TIGR03982 family)
MRTAFRIAVISLATLWIAKEIVAPATAAAIYSNRYMELVVLCDTAMNSSWYIQQSESNLLDNSELVQMLDCHDYDKTRKVLLMSGLPEDYLSYLGLRALEIYQKSPEEFVEQHRFRER